ncbi:MAG: hypothetical protein KIH01_06330 [Candidatus Freyarchaeota archaeon]|nr:hypothetical protein [Candidatus Jordarchaeia archaeon]
MTYSFEEFKREAVLGLVYQMAVSAKTAPKARGADSVRIAVVTGDDKQRLADAMHAIGEATGDKHWHRDATNVEQADAVLLLGASRRDHLGANCGACGYPTCNDRVRAGDKAPLCAFKLVDLGVAAGSAAKTASILNLDNRIMFRAGAVARQLNLIDADYILAIPVSATEKSIFFDRST